jgi:16S rRNA (guanine527-N7)-methyltransferase
VDANATRALLEGAARLGVTLEAAQREQFARYLALLTRWNQRIQLTTVTEPMEVVRRHFLDSLAVAPVLAGVASLVDVGSGAGFPGLALAVARPELRVTVVESIQKKAAFLEAVRRELGLANTEVEAVRMEQLVAHGRTFDAAVSRATFAPREWIERGTALVATGGTLAAMVVPGPSPSRGPSPSPAPSPSIDPSLGLDVLAPEWGASYVSAELLPPYAPGRALAVFRGRRAASLSS